MLWQLGSHQERFLLHLQSRQGFLLHLKSRQAHKLISELTKCGEKLFPSLSMLERFHHGQLGRRAGCGGVGRFLGLRQLCTVPFLPPITGHSISALRQQERAAVAPGWAQTRSAPGVGWRVGSAQAGPGMEPPPKAEPFPTAGVDHQPAQGSEQELCSFSSSWVLSLSWRSICGPLTGWQCSLPPTTSPSFVVF